MKLAMVCGEPLGERMAGPAIRYWELGHALAARHDVTLVAPVVDRVTPDVRLAASGGQEARAAIAGADVLITHDPRPSLLWRARRSDCRIIYDAYDPVVLENLLVARPPRLQRSVLATTAALTTLGLLAADAVICASERQRDFWLGALSALGRVDGQADPALRNLIDVVPFGVPSGRPPIAGAPPRQHLGWGSDDIVALWGGGLWDWLDGVTVVRGLALARERDKRLRLLFMGTQSPVAGAPGANALAQTHRAVSDHHLADGAVAFREGWVPYDERSAYLADADIGVSAHADHVETRFAFRTRVLDYLWAGLPCVLTEGDVFADSAVAHGFGRSVAAGDIEGWADALVGYADGRSRGEASAAALTHAETLRWPAIATRLERVMHALGSPPQTRSLEFMTGSLRYFRHATEWSLLDGRLRRLRRG